MEKEERIYNNYIINNYIIIGLGILIIIKDIIEIPYGILIINKKGIIISLILAYLYNKISNIIIKENKVQYINNNEINNKGKWNPIQIILFINIISLILYINSFNYNNFLSKPSSLYPFGLEKIEGYGGGEEIGIIFLILETYIMTVYILIYHKRYFSLSYISYKYDNIEIKENTKRIKNNLIYFYISSISTIILLLIISIIYYKYGIYNIKDYKYIKETLIYNILLIIILFKLGIFPFQIWILNIYKELDIKILLIQIIFSKFLYIYLLYNLPLNNNILYLSIINMIILPIISIKINKIKEILIYSSLFNLSFIIFTFFFTYNNNILFSYYIILYFLNTFLLFFFIIYFNNSFFNKIILFILVFSLIGFPPFSGFFIKLLLLFNIFFPGLLLYLYYLFIFFIILSSILSSIFYLKIFPLLSNSYSDIKPHVGLDEVSIILSQKKEKLPLNIINTFWVFLSLLFIIFFFLFNPFFFFFLLF